MAKYLAGLGFILCGVLAASHPHAQLLVHTNTTLSNRSGNLVLRLSSQTAWVPEWLEGALFYVLVSLYLCSGVFLLRSPKGSSWGLPFVRTRRLTKQS